MSKLELLKLLEEKERRRRTNKIASYYPDLGPLRRELYPKHTSFFAAGFANQERAAIAGNRCITPWTYIETAEGVRPSAEVLTSANATVRAWAGGLECDAPIERGFLVGIEQAFRVVLDNGQFFDCSRTHQLLTAEGWTSLDHIVQRANGLRLWHTRSSYQASCAKDGYLCDRLLPSASGSDQEQLPSQADVQRRNLVFEITGEVAQKCEYIHACPGNDRLSTPDDLRHFEDLFAMFSAASCGKSSLLLSGRSQAVHQLAIELNVQLQSCGEPFPGQPSAAHDLDQQENISLVFRDKLAPFCKEGLSAEQSLDVKVSGTTIEKLFRDESHIAIFYPSSHLEFVGGRTIVSVVPLGYQPMIDAQVPGANNYKAGGIFHHNCGKTTLSCYETTMHLTGEYPTWWVGRTFHEPVDWWAAGDTSETTRDILQLEFMGQAGAFGQGMIPERLISDVTRRRGVTDALDTVRVKHASGGISTLGFKSYDQGREKFQGTAKHGISLDEEPDPRIYFECLARLMTTNGLLICTFTPLRGISDIVFRFLPELAPPE